MSLYFCSDKNGNSKSAIPSEEKFNQIFVNLGMLAVIVGVISSTWLVSLLPTINLIFLILIILSTFVFTLFCPSSVLLKCIGLFTDEKAKKLSDVRKSLNAGASVMLISTICAILFAGTMGGKNKFFTWRGPAEEVLSFFLCFVTLIIFNSLFTTKIFNYLNSAVELKQEKEIIDQLNISTPRSLFGDANSPDTIYTSQMNFSNQSDLFNITVKK